MSEDMSTDGQPEKKSEPEEPKIGEGKQTESPETSAMNQQGSSQPQQKLTRNRKTYEEAQNFCEKCLELRRKGCSEELIAHVLEARTNEVKKCLWEYVREHSTEIPDYTKTAIFFATSNSKIGKIGGKNEKDVNYEAQIMDDGKIILTPIS